MTTFGEIVEPTSRNAWEDWDDFNVDFTVSNLTWKTNMENPGNIDKLFIFEGKYLTDIIGLQSHHKLEVVNSVQEINLNLYRIKNTRKYVCIIKNYDLLLSSDIVDLLKPVLTVCNDVVAIQTKPLAEYQSITTSNEECLIRTVTTTKSLPENKYNEFLKLEQPNIISGLTAGAICLREHLGLPGLAIICFMGHSEEYQVDEIQKLLEKLNIVQNLTSRPISILNSNLYI